jgi:hypothetical protein
MINLRYHIVSLTAVFLALGIGVMLGGTYLDKYTVDQLDKNIAAAESRINDIRAENNGLKRQLSDAQERELSLLADGSPRLVGGQLEDVPVLIVLGPGVDTAADDGVRLMLAQAGADVRATIALRDQMAFGGDEVDGDLADALGVEATRPATLRAAVYRLLTGAMHAAGQPVEPETVTTTTTTVPGATTIPGATTAPRPTTTPTTAAGPGTTAGGPTTTTTTVTGTGDDEPTGEQPLVLTELEARGYLSVEPGPGHDKSDPLLEQRGYRYVYVTTTGTTSDQLATFARLLPATPDRALPALVVSPRPVADSDGDGAANLVTQVRDSSTLRTLYSTVDDVDAFSGLVATVFVLVDAPEAQAGHYGQGPGAQAVLPGST